MIFKFKCYDCGEFIVSERDEEEVREESIKNYGIDLMASDEFYAFVCSECYYKSAFKHPVSGSLN